MWIKFGSSVKWHSSENSLGDELGPFPSTWKPLTRHQSTEVKWLIYIR